MGMSVTTPLISEVVGKTPQGTGVLRSIRELASTEVAPEVMPLATYWKMNTPMTMWAMTSLACSSVPGGCITVRTSM